MGSTGNIVISPNFMSFVSTDPSRATVVMDGSQVKDIAKDRLRREIRGELQRSMDRELVAERQRQKELFKKLESELDEYLVNLEARVETELVDLAVKVAGIILRRELPDTAMIKDILKNTLEPAVDRRAVKVILGAEDARRLQELREQEDAKGFLNSIEIVADDSLEPGDLLIESRNGCFDARISERLEILKEKLIERCRTTHADESNS